jgi:hypothetical protein
MKEKKRLPIAFPHWHDWTPLEQFDTFVYCGGGRRSVTWFLPHTLYWYAYTTNYTAILYVYKCMENFFFWTMPRISCSQRGTFFFNRFGVVVVVRWSLCCCGGFSNTGTLAPGSETGCLCQQAPVMELRYVRPSICKTGTRQYGTPTALGMYGFFCIQRTRNWTWDQNFRFETSRGSKKERWNDYTLYIYT